MAQHDTVIAQLDGKIENETKLHQEVLPVYTTLTTYIILRTFALYECLYTVYVLCSMLQCSIYVVSYAVKYKYCPQLNEFRDGVKTLEEKLEASFDTS